MLRMPILILCLICLGCDSPAPYQRSMCKTAISACDTIEDKKDRLDCIKSAFENGVCSVPSDN